MINEINKDYFCSAGMYSNKFKCCTFPGTAIKDKRKCEPPCGQRKRKHPTPEQFKKEYGHEYPDDGAVYAKTDGQEWEINTFFAAKHCNQMAVCACTPFGKPDDKWRPE